MDIFWNYTIWISVFFLIRSHVTDAIATAAGDDCIRIFEQVINYVDLTDYNRS